MCEAVMELFGNPQNSAVIEQHTINEILHAYSALAPTAHISTDEYVRFRFISPSDSGYINHSIVKSFSKVGMKHQEQEPYQSRYKLKTCATRGFKLEPYSYLHTLIKIISNRQK